MKAKKPPEVMKTARTAAVRLISGSDSEDFSNILVNQVANSLWLDRDSEARSRQIEAAIIAMLGMKPRDELEGMLITQLIASHNAAMECYRRAMLAEQTFEARRENLNQANKLSRTYAALTDALDRHRGKGQQRITVDTFPFTRYGLTHGRVERISRDAVEEPQSEQQRRQGSQSAADEPANVERAHQLVYTARIALAEKGLVIDGKLFELAPGMAVTAEIKTGKRRVLDYLLSPLHRYGHDVLRER
jgi:hypothetical protein